MLNTAQLLTDEPHWKMLEDDTKNELMTHADITNTNTQTTQYKTPANYQTAELSLNRRHDQDHTASFSHSLPKCGLHSCWINTTLYRQLLHQWTTEFNPCKSLYAAVYIFNKHLPHIMATCSILSSPVRKLKFKVHHFFLYVLSAI